MSDLHLEDGTVEPIKYSIEASCHRDRHVEYRLLLLKRKPSSPQAGMTTIAYLTFKHQDDQTERS